MKKSKKIARYARMASNEAHQEYMEVYDTFFRDILDEIIDKLDTIEAMANKKWYRR